MLQRPCINPNHSQNVVVCLSFPSVHGKYVTAFLPSCVYYVLRLQVSHAGSCFFQRLCPTFNAKGFTSVWVMGTVVLWWCLKHFSYGSLMQVYCKLNPFYTRRWSLVFPCDTALCTNTLHRSPPSCVSELLVSQAGVPLSHLSSLEKCPKTLPCCTRPQHPRTSHFCTCAMMRQQEWVALLKSGEHHTVSWFYIWFWSQFRMMKQDTSA